MYPTRTMARTTGPTGSSAVHDLLTTPKLGQSLGGLVIEKAVIGESTVRGVLAGAGTSLLGLVHHIATREQLAIVAEAIRPSRCCDGCGNPIRPTSRGPQDRLCRSRSLCATNPIRQSAPVRTRDQLADLRPWKAANSRERSSGRTMPRKAMLPPHDRCEIQRFRRHVGCRALRRRVARPAAPRVRRGRGPRTQAKKSIGSARRLAPPPSWCG